MKRVAAALLASSLLVSPVLGMLAMVPADRVDEGPIERLLANLEKNPQQQSPAQKWRAIGRVHLLAYLRQTESLPVYRDRPDGVAEGRIDDCEKLDAEVTGRGTRENFPVPKPGEKCEARSYTLGPEREAAGSLKDPAPRVDAHLRASIDAYRKARSLEPSNLRTRVALAFAYDRAGKPAHALNELRYAANQGLRRLPRPSKAGAEMSDWEMHTVLSEAQAHLELAARTLRDKRLAAQLKRRLELAPPAVYVTPILVPLKAHDGFEALVDFNSDVSFDFAGQGQQLRAGWIRTTAAWLVWDPKEKGRINSGFQMFGSVTWVSSWDNGYLALGALDDNGDGQLAGAELAGLSLWQDADSDGVSDKGEVRTLASHGVVSLKYGHERAETRYWISAGGVTFADGRTLPTYDWQLRPRLDVAEK
jgi:hypothetical protein